MESTFVILVLAQHAFEAEFMKRLVVWSGTVNSASVSARAERCTTRFLEDSTRVELYSDA